MNWLQVRERPFPDSMVSSIRGWARTAELWARSSPSSNRTIFVLGAPRSGTSLLKNLLCSHSVCVGTDRESTGLLRLRNLGKFRLGELSPDDWRKHYMTARSLPELFELTATTLREAAGANEFIDKVSIREWRLRYMCRYFPSARFISIVRDGRDAYRSALKHPNVHQSDEVRKFARYWVSCIEAPSLYLPPDQHRSIRYEDLVTRPAEVLQEIMQWLGLKYEDQQVSPSVYGRVSTLRKRRVHRNLANPITTKSVGKWRLELSESEIKRFNAVAGKQLIEAGYEL